MKARRQQDGQATSLSRDAAREEKLTALHQQLEQRIRSLRTSDDWAAWLQFASRLHHYSFNNVLLIMAQRPDATAVAGYRTWHDLGRQVDKGEKGIQILAPVVRKPRHETLAGPDEDRAAPKIVGYRVTHIYDVTQTSGDPLPDKPSPELLEGHAPEGLWGALADQVGARGYDVVRGDCGTANGVTNFVDRTVRVRPDIDDLQAVKTLAHELGHVLLHEPVIGEPVVPCRGTAEVEAESLAYLVTASQGLTTDQYSFPYVLGWATAVPLRKPEDVVAEVGKRVIRAANQVLAALDPVDDRAVSLATERAVEATNRTASLRESAATLEEAVAGSSPTQQRERLIAVHADAAEFFARKVGGSWVPGYLEHRGLAAALEPGSGWQIGYAPAGWTALVDHLRDAGYADTTLEAAGLATRARTGHLIDRFRDRLTLPILDEHDRAIAFVGRSHTDANERTPKYLNSPTTAIYRKGDHLLTASRRPGTARTPVIVEGPLDAIAVSIASPDRHVPLALCGTALTARHVELVSAIAGGPASPVVVATDADAAGQAAACTSYRLLARAGLVPWSADLPPGVDPAALLETRNGSLRLSSGLQRSAYPLIDVVVDTRVAQWSDRLQWVEGKVGVVRELAPDLALLEPEQLQRQVQRLADLTGVEPETVRQEVRQSARSWCSGGRTLSAPSRRLADAPLTQPNAASTSSLQGVFRVASATSSRGR